MDDHLISRFWDARTARVLFTVLVFALVLFFLHETRATLTLFLFAILFAYFTDPLVGRLQKPLRGRIAAIAVVYSVLLIAVAVTLYLLGPLLADEARSFVGALPES